MLAPRVEFRVWADSLVAVTSPDEARNEALLKTQVDIKLSEVYES